MIPADPPLSPTESPAAQEALSRKFVAFTVGIVPLSSGQLALFRVKGHERHLLRIRDTYDELFEGYSDEFFAAIERTRELEERRLRAQAERKAPLDDLDLDLALDLPADIQLNLEGLDLDLSL